MKIDLHRFSEKLKSIEAEDTVPGKEEVLPYLYNHILLPLLSGRLVRYGDIDFDAFEADDLRVLSYYCDEINRTVSRLEHLNQKLIETSPAASRHRAFC